MKISDECIKTSRLAVARNKYNFEKNIVVKVVYYLNIKSLDKKKYRMRDYFFKIESVGGAIEYQVIDVQYKNKKVFFLNGVSVYFIDLNSTLFDCK
jgi:hypothetical protein